MKHPIPKDSFLPNLIDGHGFYERLAEFLGVDTQNAPTILFLGEKGDKYLFNNE